MLECVLVASSHTTTIIICCPAPCSCASSSSSCSFSLALGPYMPTHINKGRRLCAQFVCNLNSHTPGRVHGSTRGPSSTTTANVASPRVACPASYSACVAVPCLLLPSACDAARVVAGGGCFPLLHVDFYASVEKVIVRKFFSHIRLEFNFSLSVGIILCL